MGVRQPPHLSTPHVLSIPSSNYMRDNTNGCSSSSRSSSGSINSSITTTTSIHDNTDHHHHHLQPNKRHCSDAYLSLMSRPTSTYTSPPHLVARSPPLHDVTRSPPLHDVTRSPPLHVVTRSPPLHDVTRSPHVCVDSVYMNVLEGCDGELPGSVPMSIPVLSDDLTL
jgi:hypothetical protein